MKKFLIYICILFITVCCNKVYALECSQSDRERLQKLASNISYVLEENQNQTITITFSGVSNDVRILNPKNLLYYRNISNSEFGEVSIKNLYPGMTYTFEIYSATNSCIIQKFRTITINIPIYNKYYNETICNDLREYKLCQKWVNNNISYDEFIEDVTNYISNKKNNTNIENNNEKSDEFNFNFGKFYKLVYFPSLIITALLTGLLVFFWNKERKKNRL